MADTRKDKRAPISLKVRFKSATLDEFIEQYSVDISRGGIFIKSKTPMSIGTLLKFEFQLKDESRLIHGVGRVVWKREEVGDKENPPGMGIKFIKMDPESRGLVEKMAESRGDAPGRFEEGANPKPKKKAASSGGFFPDTTPEDEMPPPEDRTQVRHASEFLASALAEGGSDSASEAEKKADEARKRTEEIERKRKEAKKRRKPRIKKTLVGMGIPTGGSDEDVKDAIAKLDADAAKKDADDDATEAKAAEAKAAEADAPEEKPVEEAPEEKPVEETAEETKPEAESEPEEAAEEKAEEPEPEPEEKPEAKEPESEEKPAAKEPESEDKAAAKKPEAEEKAAAKKPEPKPERAARPKPVLAKAEPAPAEEEPKSRAGMIFFALIAAAAIGVIVWMQMRQRDETTVTQDDTPIEDPNEDPLVDDEPDAGDDMAFEEPIIDEPPVETTPVQVDVTPAEAVVYVDDEEQGEGSQEVELPMGVEAVVSARLAGYVEASESVTAEEGQDAVSLTLEAMPWVIAVTTTPEGARVRGGGRSATDGEIALRGAPTSAVELRATLRNHENGTATVEPSSFSEEDGRMVAHVSIALTERVRPTGGGGGGRRGGGGSEPAGGGGTEPAGGGGTEPAGGGGTEPAGGGGTEPAGGGGTEPAGGGGTEPAGGGGEEPPPPPDNPFG